MNGNWEASITLMWMKSKMGRIRLGKSVKRLVCESIKTSTGESVGNSIWKTVDTSIWCSAFTFAPHSAWNAIWDSIRRIKLN